MSADKFSDPSRDQAEQDEGFALNKETVSDLDPQTAEMRGIKGGAETVQCTAGTCVMCVTRPMLAGDE